MVFSKWNDPSHLSMRRIRGASGASRIGNDVRARVFSRILKLRHAQPCSLVADMQSKSDGPGSTRNRPTRWLAHTAALCLSSVCVCAHATTYCAHNASELIADLAEASTAGTANGHDNAIRLAAGTFTTSSAPFTFTSASGFALTLEGGYDGIC